MKKINNMNKIMMIIFLTIIFSSCSSENNETNSNVSNISRIDVKINGMNYSFKEFTIEKHFQDPNSNYPEDSFYYVTAHTENDANLELQFGVELGLTGYWEEGEIIDEFNLLIKNGEDQCWYFGVDIPYPLINVTVNNEEKLEATFEFTSNYEGNCNSKFGDEVKYTDGIINLKL